MEFREVIKLHYVEFCEVVDPVSLASKLRSLTSCDRDVIQCKTICHGRIFGVQKLYEAIIGKVTWPEFHAALKKENLKDLLKILEEEYYRHHPTARPCPQDENLKSEFDHFEEKSTDSSADSHVNDEANSGDSTSSKTKASCVINVPHSKTIVINAYIQVGNDNCMNDNIKTSSHLQNGESKASKECEVDYEVCVESNGNGLERNDSQDLLNNDLANTVLYGIVPNDPVVPQNVSPQFSSSGSDSQDGGSPKVCCNDETTEQTAEKLVFEERNNDEIVGLAPGYNISLHENANTISQSNGHDETSDKTCFETLGISLRTEDIKCKEDEENEEEVETELKILLDEQ